MLYPMSTLPNRTRILLTFPSWEIIKYVADDPNAEFATPTNEGREAMAYLTFLYDHYDDLPEYMVFAHGHERSWHQPMPFPWLLSALNLSTVDTLGYVNLRCAPWGTLRRSKDIRAPRHH